MKRLLIYSHDTFGLGNIRRMLTISRGLLDSLPGLSILLVTGSPVIHSLQLANDVVQSGQSGQSGKLDYIKLPCLTRTARGEYRAKYLESTTAEIIGMRSELILATVRHFAPDLVMVDKKPLGVKGELEASFNFLRAERPETRAVLVLRDVLDRPETIIGNWRRNGHYNALRSFYDRVLILGQQDIFDPVAEYQFPVEVAERTRFCGYLRREVAADHSRWVRESFQLRAGQRMLLVTPGGGEDGYRVIDNCLLALAARAGKVWTNLKTLIVSGPEMPASQREELRQRASELPETSFLDFSSDLLGLISAADLIVSMGGYNTICEIVSLRKRAIVIPRVEPTEEQWIRAARMAPLGLFSVIHPDHLTPELIGAEIDRNLESPVEPESPVEMNAHSRLSLDAKRVINEEVLALLDNGKQ